VDHIAVLVAIQIELRPVDPMPTIDALKHAVGAYIECAIYSQVQPLLGISQYKYQHSFDTQQHWPVQPLVDLEEGAVME
jgi:hypothetical protein